MPDISIRLLAGRNTDTKQRLIEGITKVVCDILVKTPDHVHVKLIEIGEEPHSDTEESR
jgi:phenylpyruvate tautomerase PptA (4-oxalocrotonate tautomerase family)